MTPRSVWMIVSAVALGPAFGGLTFMVLTAITDAMGPQPPNPAVVFGIDDYWPIILVASYVLGAVPGMLSAAAMILLTRWLPTLWQRLLVAPVVGGAISAVCLSFLLLGEGIFGSLYGLMVLGVIAASGAVAALACLAIVELFHPHPAPHRAAV
jgi:hypothetical protein